MILDASVLIAASGSPTGASALILALCGRGLARVVSSRPVLLESERNIQAKLGDDALARFYKSIADLPMKILDGPTPEEIHAHKETIHPKDAHVLASAIRGNAKILLTLDRKHLLTPSVRRAKLPFAILTPGDFLRRHLA